MSYRAETRLIAEFEIVRVVVNVLRKILHAVRSARGIFGCRTLTAGVGAEDYRAAP